MRVKIVRGCTDLGYGYGANAGSREIPDEIAEVLIKHGRAVPDPLPKKKEKEPVAQTPVQPKAQTRPVKKTVKRPVSKKDGV